MLGTDEYGIDRIGFIGNGALRIENCLTIGFIDG